MIFVFKTAETVHFVFPRAPSPACSMQYRSYRQYRQASAGNSKKRFDPFDGAAPAKGDGQRLIKNAILSLISAGNPF
jgi:hypothetical protein